MLRIEILGEPPEDNALRVVADTGQTILSLLFDCGADTLRTLPHGEVKAIDHLFLSHLHMDHISGFDSFFRVNFQRTNRENHIWGPAGTAKILSHRFQGFWWSHAAELDATWRVHDVDATTIRTWRYEAREAFAIMHDEGSRAHDGTILRTREAQVEALPLEHHGLCLGYVIREPERRTVDMAAVGRLGLPAGRWLADIKDGAVAEVMIGGVAHDADRLRAEVLRAQPADSAAYLTDFLADEAQRARIAPMLKNVRTLYAEAQYAPEDGALALKYHHSTVDQIAELARAAGVERYVLLHLSRRYSRVQWAEMLQSARAIFPASLFSEQWRIAD